MTNAPWPGLATTLAELEARAREYTLAAERAEADMMATAEAPDAVRFAAMLKFYQLNGYRLGLDAALHHLRGWDRVIDDTGENLKTAELTHVLAPDGLPN